jgi:hypothetical protein
LSAVLVELAELAGSRHGLAHGAAPSRAAALGKRHRQERTLGGLGVATEPLACFGLQQVELRELPVLRAAANRILGSRESRGEGATAQGLLRRLRVVERSLSELAGSLVVRRQRDRIAFPGLLEPARGLGVRAPRVFFGERRVGGVA